MDFETTHRSFARLSPRPSQSLRNDRCQNMLYKAVFEHFVEIKDIAVLLLTSKSFQNSSFGANFIVNFAVDNDSILLTDAVLSPSSCFSLQFVPSLHIETSEAMLARDSTSSFMRALVSSKYLHLSLRSLSVANTNSTRLPNVFDVVDCFFGSGISWPQLRSLSLNSLDSVDDDVVSLICKSAPHLVILNLQNCCKISDLCLELISTLSNITSLSFSRCHLITDSGLAFISKLSGISSLNLAYCKKITAAGLEHVGNLSNIISLNLSYCYLLTDPGLRHLSRLCSITSLNLCYCDLITNVGLQHLSNLANITSLNLHNCSKISDAGLEHVCRLGEISLLDLSYCNLVTDLGLEHLRNLSSLRTLNLCNCNVSHEKKTSLRTALPNCKILQGHYEHSVMVSHSTRILNVSQRTTF